MSGQRPPTIGIIIDRWDGEHPVVASCKPSLPAARGGFRPGDVVTSIGGLLPMEFLEQPLRSRLARVEVVRDGCEIVLYLEFADAAPANPPGPAEDAPVDGASGASGAAAVMSSGPDAGISTGPAAPIAQAVVDEVAEAASPIPTGPVYRCGYEMHGKGYGVVARVGFGPADERWKLGRSDIEYGPPDRPGGR